MGMITDKVFDEAMSLPAEARLDLVERLLSSLNLPLQPEIESAWQEEAERRIDEIERGEVQLIPADEVFAKIRKSRA